MLESFTHILDKRNTSVGIYVRIVKYYGTDTNLFMKYANLLLLLILTPVQTMCYHREKMYVFVVM